MGTEQKDTMRIGWGEQFFSDKIIRLVTNCEEFKDNNIPFFIVNEKEGLLLVNSTADLPMGHKSELPLWVLLNNPDILIQEMYLAMGKHIQGRLSRPTHDVRDFPQGSDTVTVYSDIDTLKQIYEQLISSRSRCGYTYMVTA